MSATLLDPIVSQMGLENVLNLMFSTPLYYLYNKYYVHTVKHNLLLLSNNMSDYL